MDEVFAICLRNKPILGETLLQDSDGLHSITKDEVTWENARAWKLARTGDLDSIQNFFILKERG